MKIINHVFLAAALACCSLVAQDAATPPTDAKQPASQAVKQALACESKGCPQLDQHGHPPVSCSYSSGMATGWQCIIICVYEDTNWGTTVASSNCS